jgi:hypothetical protein
VTVLTRCGLSLPVYLLADAKHSRGLADSVYRPTMARGRVRWPWGYTEDASARALTQSDQEFQRGAVQPEPADRVRGMLTAGVDRTTQRLRTRFPGARLGYCLRPALNKLPRKLTAIPSPMRTALRSPFHTRWHRVRQRKGLRVLAWGQRLRRLADPVPTIAGAANGQPVRLECQETKAGWSAVLADPRMPVTSTVLDQAQTAIDRQRFMMKGCHHPTGSQQAFLRGLAHLDNLVPYQRRAQQAGQWGVEVEGGTVPTRDWCLNRPILTSGGFRGVVILLTTQWGGM